MGFVVVEPRGVIRVDAHISVPSSLWERGRRGKGLSGVHHKHHQRVQTCRAAARDLQRRIGTKTCLRPSGSHSDHVMGSTDALFSSKYIERF